MSTLGSQNVPELLTNDVEHRRQLARAINQTKRGKINVTLDVTLTPSATSTIIKDARINSDAAISPAMAMTASGASAISSIYVDNVTSPAGTVLPTATVHHANNVATDQKIRFTIIG